MRSARALFSTLAMVSMFAVACSSDSSPSANGGAGSTGASSQEGGGSGQSVSTAGASGQAGDKASGGASSSGAAGQAGSSASGGKSEAGGAGAGGTTKTGGTTSATTQPGGTTAGGRTGSGGTATTGPSSTAAGGTSAGTGGTGTASSAKGGTAGGAGGTGAGGAGGTPSSGTGTEAVKSEGCGKTPTLKGGNDPITIQSTRKYYLRIPEGYNKDTPYRLVVTYAESGSSAKSVVDRNYFRLAGFEPKNTTIFVAPDAANGAGSWSKSDVDLTDKILEQVMGDLCVDKTRIFASGFSFGGGMSIAIACTRADVFRGVAFWSGADLTNACPATLTKPIAYWASQASGDASGDPTPMSGRTFQKRFAEVNGCTADPNAINFPAAGQPHTCTTYKNCSAGHPTIYCVFNGGHGWEPVDPGQSTSWAPKEAWAFITQF